MAQERVSVFDVTMREGEQTPGVRFSADEKLQLATQMVEAGIRMLEVGVVGLGEDEHAYSQMIDNGLGERAEISMTLLPKTHLVNRFLKSEFLQANLMFPVSDHLARTFNFSMDSFLAGKEKWITDFIAEARNKDKQVRVALAQVSRLASTNADLLDPGIPEISLAELIQIIETFKDHGAAGFILTDTQGLLTPATTRGLVKKLKSVLGGSAWGVHCHNDFGMAAANTLVAYEEGATLLQTTFNHLGERNGIATTPEIAASLKKLYGADTGLDLTKLRRLSEDFERLSGEIISERETVVGRGLYRLETATPLRTTLDANLKTYGPITAEEVGRKRTLVIGKHTSPGIIKAAKARGIIPAEGDYAQLKKRAEEKHTKFIKEKRRIIQGYHEASESALLHFELDGNAKPSK